MPLRYWALLLFLGTVWGGSFMFNAILIREIDPLWVSAGRVIIGAAICWVYFFATKRKLPEDPWIYASSCFSASSTTPFPSRCSPMPNSTCRAALSA